MFDKLNGFGMKAERGDLFHIDSAGRTLTYKVVSINVVTPDDFTRLKIEPGRDIVTLLTCTPYGINDHRLLVAGERTAMSETMEEQCESDGTIVYLTLYVIAFWIIISVVASATLVHNEHKGVRPKSISVRGVPRHSSGLKASNNLLTISSNGRGRTEDRRSHHLGVSNDGGKRMIKRVLKG